MLVKQQALIRVVNLVVVVTELLVDNLLVDIGFRGVDGVEAIGKDCLQIILLLTKYFYWLKHAVGSSS